MHKLPLLVALVACGDGATPAAPKTAAAPPAAKPPIVELAELKFYAGDDLGMQLHADGHVLVMTEARWVDIGRIAPDGTITGPDGATQRGRITADGSLVAASGKPAPFHLEGDALVIANKRFTIDARGVLQGASYPMRIEGATTPGLWRTALVLLASLMTSARRE
jgi:hypothetical protein